MISINKQEGGDEIMHDGAIQLLTACVSARQGGADFPTIWLLVLKRHSLVKDIPYHAQKDGKTLLIIPLITGQRLIFDGDAFSLA